MNVFYNRLTRSIFGENALANLSIEKPVEDPDSKVTGHIRIRAKSQVRFNRIFKKSCKYEFNRNLVL